jgi:MOSC domain-containing protein YiiM
MFIDRPGPSENDEGKFLSNNENLSGRPALLGIFMSADMGEVMKEVQSAKLLAGVGIEGDRYATRKGAFNKGEKKRIPDSDRQVTLISSSAIAEANEELLAQGKPPFSNFETRRNLIVNISPDDLNNLVGKKFKLGEVIMQAVELCEPCDRPDGLSGKKGFKLAFENRGGIRVRVLNDGVIGLGDTLDFKPLV